METPTSKSGRPASKSLIKVVEKTIKKGSSDSYYINSAIKRTLYDLSFIKKRLTLKVEDPSYKLRYLYALEFWKKRTEKCETLSREEADALVEELKGELNNKFCLYPEESNENEEDLDEFYSQSPKPKSRRTSKQLSVDPDEQPVWYVTSKCENVFYLKSTNSSKNEIKVNKTDIELCSYSLICPGDELRIESDGEKKRVCIVRSKGLTLVESYEDEAKFIENLVNQFENRGHVHGDNTWGSVCYNILYKRCEGIWSHIKNDEALFEDTQCVKNVLKLSFLLTKELSVGGDHTDCSRFLEDLSCSLFFKTALPQLIQSNYSELKNDDLTGLKLLLESMMKYSSKTAAKILKVAKHLAHAMHDKTSAVDYLVHLGEILAKAVQGCEDVDTVNCEWTELPTIPTDKEIWTAFDLKGLEPIRREKPYESTEQYLDINYRLLREECYRNLCTGIQNFSYHERTNDTRQMKIYRIIKLDTISRGNTQTILVLNCENYYKKEDSVEEEEDTSSKILYGSLMCISLNKKFNSLIWATVVDFKQPKDSNTKTVSVKLCSKRNKLTNIEVLLKLLELTNEGDHALMAESPTFYSAFGPCMDRLQEMHKKGNMPLVDELVFAKKSDPPSYTQDENKTCDWSIIFKKPTGCDFTFPKDRKLSPVEQFKHLKENIDLESWLDKTQLEAIANFLEHRVSLIQGPPGTGKSFLGSKILGLMLSMGIHEKGHPILIMTYKNFALDHFLERCLEHNPKIVRIGQAGKENLSFINLKSLNQGKRFPEELKPMYDEATEKMRKSLSKLKWLFKCLTDQVLTFLEAATEDHIRCLLTMSEDPDQNTDEAMVDQLLDKWRQKDESTELKEHLRKSLQRWLPKTEIPERRDDYKEKDHNHPQKLSVSSSKKDEEECLDEAIDSKVVAQERQKEAIDDFAEEDGEILDKPTILEELGDDEPLSYQETELNRFDEVNLWDLSPEKRVSFICALQSKIIPKFTKAVKNYEQEAQKRQEILDKGTVKFLKTFEVIGMTITGAATRLHLLDKLEPCAVIVEEAAEIIEGQLISVLPPTIQHLVMLGDQEQLKPRVNCYKLTRKNLDCSMFERLINNNMPFQQLGRQCRMRKDIAQLLRSLNIYKDLQTNDELTCNNQPPECIGRSLYFIKHTRIEEKIRGSNSLCNQKEILLILDVAEYLLKNGYPACDITVLCPYRGQVMKMKAAFEKRSLDPQEEHFTKLRDVNITTVDSFQGEENKVILLSLVRSNPDDKIGFLAQKNRICVAISRAQCALYIFGNSANYSRSQNWKKIIQFLEDKNLVGGSLRFKEELDGINTTADEEPFGDATPLFSPEINLLSKQLIEKYLQIARLENLDTGMVKNVHLDHVNYKTPIDKAEEILSMISKKPDFSRKILSDHLEEEGLKCLKDIVLNGSYRYGVDSPGVSTNTTAEN